MSVVFLSSGHLPLDDRIFHHMAHAILKTGKKVGIITSNSDMQEDIDQISIDCFESHDLTKKEKIASFITKLSKHNPEKIICSEPLPVIAAHYFNKKRKKKAKIIYDITEWYPSKKNLSIYSGWKKIWPFFTLLIFNFYACSKADAFIFGEYYKEIPWKYLFPLKKRIRIPYFPKPELFPLNPTTSSSNNALNLMYSGKLSKEKGLENFLKAIQAIQTLRPEMKIQCKLVGWFESEQDKEHYLKQFKGLPYVSLLHIPSLPLTNYIEYITDTDVFLDLRITDFENMHCLPIKLFYFVALGKPVIFSRLKAIQKEVEIDQFGHLVKPTDSEHIAKLIIEYKENPAYYNSHCENARNLYTSKYNWKLLEGAFVDFVASI
ncbi:MAG: glycosyltransferase [Bacteroidetes bacterium]|nr:MAG: glycosyltransferase [Bacteroidota bacterium]